MAAKKMSDTQAAWLSARVNLLGKLQKLKEEGKVRFVGMTGYPLAVQQEIITRSGVGIDTSLSCAAQFGRAIRPRNSAQFCA